MQAIHAVNIGGFDVMLMTETNITDQAYCRNRLGYSVVCLPEITTTAGGVQGGVVLVVRDRPHGWSVELTSFHGPNLVSCEVVSGGKRTPIVGS